MGVLYFNGPYLLIKDNKTKQQQQHNKQQQQQNKANLQNMKELQNLLQMPETKNKSCK